MAFLSLSSRIAIMRIATVSMPRWRKTIDAFEPDIVVLAGFMRILSAGFVSRYHGRLINIHPSLLPAYGGLNTHARALQDGVRIHGCTVHFVTPDLDHGPIIIQAAVPVLHDDTEQTLAARVLHEEHRIYPQAIRWLCQRTNYPGRAGQGDIPVSQAVRLCAGHPQSGVTMKHPPGIFGMV